MRVVASDETSVDWGCVHAANSTIDVTKSTILYDPDPMFPNNSLSGP